MNGGMHANPHVEPAHVGTPPTGAVHTLPQVRQLEGSDVVSTQEPLQLVRLPPQFPEQLPPEHTWPLQFVGQVPQCAGSDAKSTHPTPGQSVNPGKHCEPQVLFTH